MPIVFLQYIHLRYQLSTQKSSLVEGSATTPPRFNHLLPQTRQEVFAILS